MKKVIYTSLVGNYDTLEEPIYRMEGWDYVCFSNNIKQKENSCWEIKPIPYINGSNIILSRYAKLNPHLVLKKYDVSVYLDSNINVLDNVLETKANQLINSNINISIAKHPFRDCIYQEAEVCISKGIGDKKSIQNQLRFLKSENFPKNYGLFENNIIFRKHNKEEIIELSKKWWELYLRFSKRDQLSLAYLFWKNKVCCTPLFEEGFNVRESKYFLYKYHNISFIGKIKIKVRGIIQSFLLKY